MRLFLIRHGETVDNVAGVYAGITDSALTSHGVLQANRLGQYLADTGFKVSHIFSSDLVRAFKTAEAIRLAQPKAEDGLPIVRQVIQLTLLRERDFGSYEGKVFSERSRNLNKTGTESHYEVHKDNVGFKDMESKEEMRARMDTFVQDHLLNLFETLSDDNSMVVVAHGIILSHLWGSIVKRFPPGLVSIAPGAVSTYQSSDLMHLGSWSNTGYLESELKILKEPSVMHKPISISKPEASSIKTTTSLKVLEMSLVVNAVNSLEHLKGLKKTRGGIGSSKHDESQKTIESFFKKRKIS